MLNRRNFLKRIAAGTTASIVAASVPLYAHATKTSTRKLVILHTNDVHSRIEPFPRENTKWGNIGGFSRRATLVSEIRKQEPNVLLLDAGDVFQGTPYFNFFKGEIEYKLMSQMGYDAGTFGNHEFDNGVEGLIHAMPHAQFPFLVSNYQFDDPAIQNKVHKQLIINKGGIKIGLFGLCVNLEGLTSAAHRKGVTYMDPLAVALEHSKQLKLVEKCDVVIAVSHLGYHYTDSKISDCVIAQNTEHIDLIIGGHTHTLLKTAAIEKNLVGKDVYIGQTGWGGTNLGRIDLTL